MNKIKSVLFVAGISLALAFAFGCSSDDGTSGSSAPSGSYGSSSSIIGRSSSSFRFNFDVTKICPNAVTSDSTVSCGGKKYRTVQIGTQTWMANNLNYVGNRIIPKCYENDETTCSMGVLYNWETAMTICPFGWHLPSRAEWVKLVNYVDSASGTSNLSNPYSSQTAGRSLKAINGWDNNENGNDTYDFSALPGDACNYKDNCRFNGSRGSWWSSSNEIEESGSGYETNIFYMLITGPVFFTSQRSYYLNWSSVRCVKD